MSDRKEIERSERPATLTSERSRPKRLDVAASLGYSVDARLRVIAGTKSALQGKEASPDEISLASHVEEYPDGLRNSYGGVQASWNEEREKVNVTREEWGISAAKATLRLLYNHKDDPENLALLQTAFQNWGITVNSASLHDMSQLEREVGVVAASFSGEFYEQFCGEDQMNGVQALERRFLWGMEKAYMQKHKLGIEKFYTNATAISRSSSRVKEALGLLDPFLKRYFGSEDLYTTFQLCLASDITVRSRELFPKILAVGEVSPSEERALMLISEHLPEEKPAAEPMNFVSEDFFRRRDTALGEGDPEPGYTFSDFEQDLHILSIPADLKEGQRIEAPLAAQIMEQLHQRVQQAESEGFEKPAGMHAQGSAALDAMRTAEASTDQIAILYEGSPLKEMVIHQDTMDYLKQRQKIYAVLSHEGGLDTTDPSPEVIELGQEMGKSTNSLILSIAQVAIQPPEVQAAAVLNVFKGSTLAEEVLRFGGLEMIEQNATTTMTRAARGVLGANLPPSIGLGKALSEEEAETLVNNLIQEGKLQAGTDVSDYVGRLKAMPMAYDQLYFILDAIKRNREMASSYRRRAQTPVSELQVPDWLLSGHEDDPLSHWGPPPPPTV